MPLISRLLQFAAQSKKHFLLRWTISKLCHLLLSDIKTQLNPLTWPEPLCVNRHQRPGGWLPLRRQEKWGVGRQTWRRKLPTRDRRAGRQGVYSPLSSWINIWSAELWWVLISALIRSVSTHWLWSLFRWTHTHICNLWMSNVIERLTA